MDPLGWLDPELQFPVVLLVTAAFLLGVAIVLVLRFMRMAGSGRTRSRDAAAPASTSIAGESPGGKSTFPIRLRPAAAAANDPVVHDPIAAPPEVAAAPIGHAPTRRAARIGRAVLVILAVVAAADHGVRALLDQVRLGDIAGLQLRLWVIIVVTFASMAPTERPSLRGVALGTLAGALVAVALFIVWLFGTAQIHAIALPGLAVNVIGATLMALAAAVAAGLASHALAAIATRVRDADVRQKLGLGALALCLAFLGYFAPKIVAAMAAAALGAYGLVLSVGALVEAGWMRRRPALAALVLIVAATAFVTWQLASPAKFDPAYRLTPSTWRGEIAFQANTYPFTLVIEKVDAAGQFTGYMDWQPPYPRLRIEGRANGNHLVFDDTDRDRKEVWIDGSMMRGTDKNGAANLNADLVAAQSPASPAQAPAPVGFPEIAPPEPAPRTEMTARSERLCTRIGEFDNGRHTASCWTTLAIESRRSTYCDVIADAPARARCFDTFAIVIGDPGACHARGAQGLEACIVAAAAAKGGAMCDRAIPAAARELRKACIVAAASDRIRCAREISESTYATKCDQAVVAMGNARMTAGAVKQLVFFRDYAVGTPSIEDCRAPAAGNIEEELCRIERARRGEPDERCDGFREPILGDACRAMRAGR